MNASLPLFAAFAGAATDKAANLLAAARAMTPHLNRSRALDRKLVSGVLTTPFGASDAEGAWLWRDAYDAIEAALVLQLRRLAPQIGRLEAASAEICPLDAPVDFATISKRSMAVFQPSVARCAPDAFRGGISLSRVIVFRAAQCGDRSQAVGSGPWRWAR